MKPVRTYLSQFLHTTNHEVQPADLSTAKAWVRNPAGAICRKDNICLSGLSPSAFPPSVCIPCPVPGIASGLASQLPGSVGKLFRPATVKLLNCPPATEAHCWLSSEVASSGVFPSG